VKTEGSRTVSTPIALAGCVIAAAALSVALDHFFDGAGPFTLMPPLLIIFVAHQVFVAEVACAEIRRTAAGRWAGLAYFGIFLAALIGAYGYAFSLTGLHDAARGSETHDFATGLFFSVVTWTTVGYGDVTATTPIARLIAAAEALNGYLVLALFIAALVPVFQRLLQDGNRTDETDPPSAG